MESYSVQAVLSAVDKNFSKTFASATKAADSFGNNTTKSTGLGGKGMIKFGAVAGAATAVVSKALSVVSSSVGGAVARFDTLNTYPKVMKQMGFSTQDTNKSVGILKKGIDGLPTSLQDITKNAQSFAILTNSATKGAQTANALNDAFLASGASSADASRGVEQYSQMLASGTVDAQGWRTMTQTMPYALQEVAKSFGLTGESAKNDLYKKLQSGEITMKQLNDRFIELDGGAKGFAKTARKSTGGIATSFTNMRNAVTNGLAEMLKSIDNGLKKAGTGGFAKIFDNIKVAINNSFSAINSTITKYIPVIVNTIKTLFDFVKSNASWITPLVIGIGTFVTTMKTMMTIISIVSAVGKAYTALKTAMVIGQAVAGVISGSKAAASALTFMAGKSKLAAFALKMLSGPFPFMIIIAAITAVVAALVWFFTQTKTGKKAWSDFTKWLGDVWNGLVDIVSAVGQAIVDGWNAAVDGVKNVWSGIGDFFSGVWNGIVTGATTAWTGITTFLTSVWTGISTTAMSIWNGIKTFFTTIWEGIISVITSVWTGISTFLTTVWNGIKTVASIVWNGLKALIAGIAVAILVAVTGPFGALALFVAANFNTIKSVAVTVWNGIKSVISTVVSAILSVVTNIWNTIKSVTSSVWNGVKSVTNSVWNGIKSVISSVVRSVKSVVLSVWNAIKSATSSTWNSIKSLTSSAWNGIKSVVSSAVNAVKSVVTRVWSAIRSATSSAWNAIKSVISSGINAARSVVSSAVNAMRSAATSAWNAMKSAASSVVSGIKSSFHSLSSINLGAAGSAIMNSFLGGLRSAWGGVKNFVSGIAGWIKKHKGPISYDRKLLIPAGSAIMTGLNAGLADNFKAVQKNVSGMAGSILDTATSVGNLATNAIGDPINALNNNIGGSYSSVMTLDHTSTTQPANITIGFDKHGYTAYVDDINNQQGKTALLKRNNSVQL
ncbi:tape measure protein [Leuconostoc sp.]|uniref:tape measure protein n=1 Tax=Leuconostoc sp. TaxID=1930076 RepID=UPI0029589773|nr:tape measure protein [Leuconostoc sp.]MDV8935956.1 tape measure protein [Leuconostoc sp.]